MTICFLWAFHNKPLPVLPLGVTLNAILALLTTVTKASLLFPVTESMSQWKWNWFQTDRALSDFHVLDSASRSVTGSAKLIRRMKLRFVYGYV